MLTWIELEEIEEVLTGHSAAQEPWNEKRVAVCAKLWWLCNKLTFDSNIGDYERYAYTLLLWHTISKIESFGYPTLEETLNTVTIQKPKWWRRWYAWHDLIVFNVQNIKNFSEFYQVATHELWHILDLWVIQWNSQQYNSDYTEFWEVAFFDDDISLDYYKISWINENTKKWESSFKDYVSWYWMTNPFEDFAEAMNMYLNNNELFASMSSESDVLSRKYDFMKRLFAWWYTYRSLSGVKSLKQSNRRPWDSTRLSN